MLSHCLSPELHAGHHGHARGLQRTVPRSLQHADKLNVGLPFRVANGANSLTAGHLHDTEAARTGGRLEGWWENMKVPRLPTIYWYTRTSLWSARSANPDDSETSP